MIKILHITGGPLDFGGITSFLYSHIKYLNPTKFSVDIIALDNSSPEKLLAFESLGVRVIHIPYRKNNLFLHCYYLCKHLASNSYNVLHCHEDIFNFLPIFFAKVFSRRSAIVIHSHNTGFTNTTFGRAFFYKLLFPLNRFFNATRLACSQEAGLWLFASKPFTVIPNSIDINSYQFNNLERLETRNRLSLKRKFVIGFFGRMDEQKNPKFAIDLAYSLSTCHSDIIFLMVGGGKLLSKLKGEYSAIRSIRWLGYRQNVTSYMSACDLYIMPSKFEGLGISAVEAQVNGLFCLLSDAIPKEVALSDRVKFLPLELNMWKSEILNIYKSSFKRAVNTPSFANFDISVNIKVLEEIYENVCI